MQKIPWTLGNDRDSIIFSPSPLFSVGPAMSGVFVDIYLQSNCQLGGMVGYTLWEWEIWMIQWEISRIRINGGTELYQIDKAIVWGEDSLKIRPEKFWPYIW